MSIKQDIEIRAAVVLHRDGKVLLVKHRKRGMEYWVLPGGHQEAGESVPDAARRELREETGLEVKTGRLLLVDDYLAADGKRQVVNLYYEGELAGGKLKVVPHEAVVGAEWLPLELLRAVRLLPDLADVIIEGVRSNWREAPLYLGNLEASAISKVQSPESN